MTASKNCSQKVGNFGKTIGLHVISISPGQNTIRGLLFMPRIFVYQREDKSIILGEPVV